MYDLPLAAPSYPALGFACRERNATRAARKWTEVHASCEVMRRVYSRFSGEGWRKQIWVPRWRKLHRGIEGVTPIAIPRRIDNVTAQSNQPAILSNKIQWHGGNRKALL